MREQQGEMSGLECAIWNKVKVTLAYQFSRFFNPDEELDGCQELLCPTSFMD
jgi:opacity protein-like surface antigen